MSVKTQNLTHKIIQKIRKPIIKPTKKIISKKDALYQKDLKQGRKNWLRYDLQKV